MTITLRELLRTALHYDLGSALRQAATSVAPALICTYLAGLMLGEAVHGLNAWLSGASRAAALPAEAEPSAALPPEALSLEAVPLGAMPLEAMPLEAVPLGAMPPEPRGTTAAAGRSKPRGFR